MSELKRYSYKIWPQYAAFQGNLVEDKEGELIKSSEFDEWNTRTPQQELISVDTPPENNEDVICIKESGFMQIDYYQDGRFRLSDDYKYWMEKPALPTPPKQ